MANNNKEMENIEEKRDLARLHWKYILKRPQLLWDYATISSLPLVNWDFIRSHPNKPWDLYLAENTKETSLKQITKSPSDAFQNYKWRTPPIITYNAADGEEIHARIYEPTADKKNGAAVFFVHGAIYKMPIIGGVDIIANTCLITCFVIKDIQ